MLVHPDPECPTRGDVCDHGFAERLGIRTYSGHLTMALFTSATLRPIVLDGII
jgi:hypothetical protein